MAGEFNLHVDIPSDSTVMDFIQQVTGPTHEQGHSQSHFRSYMLVSCSSQKVTFNVVRPKGQSLVPYYSVLFMYMLLLGSIIHKHGNKLCR